ncbi:MAG: hypothetical protein GY800_00780 [Planctomycetes bacterium]|nr:hypothetical protein [Planctomycetota bacterium]
MSSLKWVLLAPAVNVVLVAVVVFGSGCLESKKVVTIDKYYGGAEEGSDPDGLKLEETMSDTKRTHTYFVDRMEDGERYKEYPRIVAYVNGKIEIIGPGEEEWRLDWNADGDMYLKSHENPSHPVESPQTYKEWVVTWWNFGDSKVIVLDDTSRDGQKTFQISVE